MDALKNENILRNYAQQFFEPFTKECSQFDSKCKQLDQKISYAIHRIEEMDYLASKQRQSLNLYEAVDIRLKKLVISL